MPKTTAPRPSTPTSIRRILGEEKIPLLPFERALLVQRLQDFGVAQKTLAGLLGEAMSGTETFHDNAEAEAVVDASTQLSDRARRVLHNLDLSVLVGYPRQNLAKATVGSIVSVAYGIDDEPEQYLLTGSLREVPDIRHSSPYSPDMHGISVASPLGAAVFGRPVGYDFRYAVPNGDVNASIASIAQFDPQFLI